MKKENGRSIAVVCAILYVAGTLAAQPVVVTGTGNPDVDVPAVQAAVNRGGRVVLTGHSSFDRAATIPAGETYSRMVTITKETTVFGGADQNRELPVIDGGNWPFFW